MASPGGGEPSAPPAMARENLRPPALQPTGLRVKTNLGDYILPPPANLSEMTGRDLIGERAGFWSARCCLL